MADNNSIRIGKVSSVNYGRGTIRVAYTDKNAVSAELPFLTFNDEYKMPNIDDMVLVMHLSNGTAVGFVCGTFWSDTKKPPESGKGLYRKDLGQSQGEAYIKYSDGVLTLKADKIILESSSVGTSTINVDTVNAGTVNADVLNG